MKTLTLRKLLKYSLACICATCAMIAGVFAMSTNTVKAEETTIDAPKLNTVALIPDQDIVNATVTLTSDLVNRLKTYTASNYERENFQTAPNYSIGDYWADNIYYIVLNYSENVSDYGKVLSDSTNSLWFGSSDNLTAEQLTPTVSELNITTNASGTSTMVVSLPINFDFSKTYYYWFSIVKHSHINYIDKVTSHQGVLSISQNHYYYKDRIYSQSDYRELNIKEKATSYLKTIASDSDVGYNDGLLKYAGYTVKSTDNVTVNLTYKKVKDFAQVETVTEPFIIPGWRIIQENYIKNYMYNVLGYANISDFNAVYTDSYIIDGSIYDTQDRVFLQAESLDYTFDTSTNVGTLNVVYAPFKYSNFVIRITNNDPTNNLTIDYFTADIVDNGTKTVLTYNFDTIERQLFNSLKWLFDIQQEDFTINSASNVTTALSDTALTITFSNSYENNLSNLSVMLVTEIMEDYELNVIYRYAKLDEELNETVQNTGLGKMYYSDLVALGNENFKTLDATKSVYELAINSIKPEVLNGQAFYTYKGIKKVYTNDKTGCTVHVEYDYTTLLKVTDSLSTSTVYVALDSNSLTYTYDDLPFSVPNGWRIKNVTKAVGDSVKIAFSEHTPEDLTVTINESTSQKKIITLTAELSDTWYVKVNYLERYKNTPFATLETVTKEVKVSEYGEIKNINANNTAKIVGKSTLNVLKSAVEKLDVQYNGTSTYTITPKYTYLSLKAIDYNGNSNEVKVPLTCYEQYCDMFGHDWSILWLNTIDNEYFEFSNSVERNKLYGYFNVAVFETQVSDLNALFSNNTGDGCMTVFKSQQVVGSSLYRFANNMKDSALFGGAGYTLMSFCEIANDNNKILDSYFFFLDITSDKPFLSNGGADNSEDDDSASENFGEDVVDGVKDKVDEWGVSFSEWLETNPFAQFLKILGFVLLGGVVLFVLVWLFKKVK